MTAHPYRSPPSVADAAPLRRSDDLRLENALVGGVLCAAGGVGLVLGLLRATQTLEAGFGAVIVLLGTATLARRSAWS